VNRSVLEHLPAYLFASQSKAFPEFNPLADFIVFDNQRSLGCWLTFLGSPVASSARGDQDLFPKHFKHAYKPPDATPLLTYGGLMLELRACYRHAKEEDLATRALDAPKMTKGTSTGHKSRISMLYWIT